MNLPDYAELHCLSQFSFGRGASSARELFERAKQQGYAALAITDECTLAGIVRAWQAAKDNGLALIVGSEMRIEDGPKLVLLAENLAGYQALCRLVTTAHPQSELVDFTVRFIAVTPVGSRPTFTCVDVDATTCQLRGELDDGTVTVTGRATVREAPRDVGGHG